MTVNGTRKAARSALRRGEAEARTRCSGRVRTAELRAVSAIKPIPREFGSAHDAGGVAQCGEFKGNKRLEFRRAVKRGQFLLEWLHKGVTGFDQAAADDKDIRIEGLCKNPDQGSKGTDRVFAEFAAEVIALGGESKDFFSRDTAGGAQGAGDAAFKIPLSAARHGAGSGVDFGTAEVAAGARFAAGADDDMAAFSGAPVGAAEEAAVHDDAAAEARAERERNLATGAAAGTEPVFAEGDQIDIIVNGGGHTGPRAQMLGQRYTRPAGDMRLHVGDAAVVVIHGAR